MRSREVWVALALLLAIVATAALLTLETEPTELGFMGLVAVAMVNGAAFFGGPAQVLAVVGGGRYPAVWLGLAMGFANAIGETVGLFVGRETRSNVHRSPKLADRIQRLEASGFAERFKTHPNIYLFLLASVPNPLFDPASVLAGLLGFRWTQYLAPVLFGKALRFLVLTHSTRFFL